MTGPAVLLCDLNSALSANMKQVFANAGRMGFGNAIRDVERYRPEVVEWLKEHQRLGWQVRLYTVRRVEWESVTLASIGDKTGWQPDGAYFNDTEFDGKHAPKVKGKYVDRLRAEQPRDLLAFESNAAVRAMLRKRGIAFIKSQDRPLPEASLPRAGAAPFPAGS